MSDPAGPQPLRPDLPPIRLPAHMLQGLLGGPQPAAKKPEPVEVKCGDGRRFSFNVDSVKAVSEEKDNDECLVYLKEMENAVSVAMNYDDFLREINVTPRVLGREE